VRNAYSQSDRTELQASWFWVVFSGKRNSDLGVVEVNQDAWKYIACLEDYLIPFVGEEHSDRWVFMQDGASPHRANIKKDWLNEKEIALMDWPAKSPDLNPIENLWGILARRVYANQRQFNDVEELNDVVMEAWDAIGMDTIQKLLQSMQKRCLEVLQQKEKKNKY